MVVEMLANVNLERDMKMVRKKGKILVVGSRGRIEIAPRDFMAKESCVIGVILWEMSEDEKEETLARIESGLENGSLKPQVGKVYELSEAAQAHVEIIEGVAKGKVILRLPDSS